MEDAQNQFDKLFDTREHIHYTICPTGPTG
jgi:hypothetical protein